MKNKHQFFFLVILTLINGCTDKVEETFSNFYYQVEGEWTTSNIELLGVADSTLVPNEMKVKFIPCSKSPCILSYSIDKGDYIDIQYDRAIGFNGSSKKEKIFLSIKRPEQMDKLTIKEKYFAENVQVFQVQSFQKEELKIDIPVYDGPNFETTFIRL